MNKLNEKQQVSLENPVRSIACTKTKDTFYFLYYSLINTKRFTDGCVKLPVSDCSVSWLTDCDEIDLPAAGVPKSW